VPQDVNTKLLFHKGLARWPEALIPPAVRLWDGIIPQPNSEPSPPYRVDSLDRRAGLVQAGHSARVPSPRIGIIRRSRETPAESLAAR
jgi:hypothetical protein